MKSNTTTSGENLKPVEVKGPRSFNSSLPQPALVVKRTEDGPFHSDEWHLKNFPLPPAPVPPLTAAAKSEHEQMSMEFDDLDAPYGAWPNWHTYKTFVIAHERHRAKLYEEGRFGTLEGLIDMAKFAITDSATNNQWISPQSNWVSVDLDKVVYKEIWDFIMQELKDNDYDCEKLGRGAIDYIKDADPKAKVLDHEPDMERDSFTSTYATGHTHKKAS